MTTTVFMNDAAAAQALPGRPAPHLISFAASCFEIVGERIEYSVALSAPSYPVKFDDKAEAESFAFARRRAVSERRVQLRRRISWT